VVVEGYFDCDRLPRPPASPMRRGMASLRPALSSQADHPALPLTCERPPARAQFRTDGAGVRDRPGGRSARVEQLALAGQLELRGAHLPAGKDPDDFLQGTRRR